MLFKTAFFVFSTDESNFLIYKKALPKQSFLTLVRLCFGVLILLDDRKDQTQQRQHDRRDDIQGNSQRVV